MIDVAKIAESLGGAARSGAGWVCRCPAHEDARASLSIAAGDDVELVAHCHAGCEQSAVLDALRARGLLNGTDRSGALDFTITALGKPTNVWTYHDATGATELLKVARYATPGGKEIRPWIRDGARWKCGAHPTPRPLYGLDMLAKQPTLPALVVEGEKTCDAARELVGTRYVVVTWPGGANAADKVDWRPLRGRDVTLWPDADAPGEKAMRTAAAKLASIAIGIAIVEPGDRAAGWDVADAKAEGWSGDDVATFIEEHSKSVKVDDVPPSDVNELSYDFADKLPDIGDEADELIERLFTRGAMGVIYGDSNSGKTFLAIDIGCAIPRSIRWMGRNTEPGMVVYLATESPASVRRRLRAYQRYHDCRVPNFVIVNSPIDLYDGSADSDRVIALVHSLERRQGVKCELIIGDTLSRLCAGANENSGEDMSVVVRHVDHIRNETGAHFLLIHHTGKDAARGMRGWSGMRGAIDTEIEITVDSETGTHAAEVTKQRDIPGKGERIGFRLQVVEMGIGKWGKPVTSCVVLDADAPAKAAPGKRPSEIAGAITEFLTSRAAGIKKGELVDHFDGRYARSAVYREMKKMSEAGKLREAVGIVALARP